RGASDHRAGPPVAAAVVGRPGPDPPAGCGRRRPARRPPRRAAGRHPDRPDRRAVLHRPRPPPEAGGPVSTVLEPAARDAARAGMLVVRVPRVGWSARVDRRAVLVTIVLVAVALGVFAWSLTVGDYSIALRDVVRILLGRGEGGPAYVVRELRLPRGLTALLVGAAFGLAGAIFQRLAHNPLASPDIIGINAGASAAAAFAIIVLDLAGTAVTAAALVGAALAATAMFLLAY